MSRESTKKYIQEILTLKEEYRDSIDIFCGIEQDLFGDDAPTGFDFVIGSVHYVKDGDPKLCVDYSAEMLKNSISDHFADDPYAYAEEYYNKVFELCADPIVDIIGHFDLLTKFNEKNPLFDESHPRYVAAWTKALDAVAESGKFLEINSGAIPRGYRTSCYPAPPVMQRAKELNIPLLITCDCHSADSLLSSWQLSYNYALSCGFTEEKLTSDQNLFLKKVNSD